MNSKLLLWLFTLALPGYRYEFPRDHFNHPEFATEWWYYTGNLNGSDGHRYGYELTFFRAANDAAMTLPKSTWDASQLYMAHLALSDIDGQKFEHTQRLNRAGPGLAGADFDGRKYWNGNWNVKWTSDEGDQQLQAVGSSYTLNLRLHPAKPPVIHGIDGVSQKGAEQDEASHYISFTRLLSEGTLVRGGKTTTVKGSSWMDHEFFPHSKTSYISGWDWFAVQLDNNEELMLYRLRLKSGQVSPYSSGTFIDSSGKARHLTMHDFRLTPGGWAGVYPLAWNIAIPSIEVELQQSTRLKQQELTSESSISPTYWEGAVDFKGTSRGKPVTGVGYLEMTGYKPFEFH